MAPNLTSTDPEDISDGGDIGAEARSQPNVAVQIAVQIAVRIAVLIDLLQLNHSFKGQGRPS